MRGSAVTPLVAALLLSGCGLMSAHEARDPRGSLIGHNVVDLLDCAGIPDSRQQVAPDVGVMQWSFKSNDPEIKATIAVIGTISLGSAPQCKMVATFLRDGTVVDVSFPACTSSVFDGPYADAWPLVGECLAHPNSVSLPVGYDAMVVLFPGK